MSWYWVKYFVIWLSLRWTRINCVTCCRRHCPLAFCATSSRYPFPPVSRRSAHKHVPRALLRGQSEPRVRYWDAACRRIRCCWCARPLSLKAKASLGIYASHRRKRKTMRHAIASHAKHHFWKVLQNLCFCTKLDAIKIANRSIIS